LLGKRDKYIHYPLKKIVFILLLLCSFLAFAQNIEAEFLSQQRENFGRTFEQRLSKTNQVLMIAEDFANEKGIQTKRISLKNRDGKTYSALEITPQGTSLQNQEAFRISQAMSNLPLVFSPFDLSTGSEAFFDPNGSKLGVPYAFFTTGPNDPSYKHELYHAETYLKVITNKKTIWAGVMKVLKGNYISLANGQYYFRFASLDELNATAYSVKLETEVLMELYRTQTSLDFYRSRGTADQTINSIYQSILAGKYLAKQAADVASRSIQQISSAESRMINLSLGDNTQSVIETVFNLDSYDREVANRSVTYPSGTVFTLYSTSFESPGDLEKRLREIKLKASEAEKLFIEVEKKIYVLIEYPRLEKTDLKGLAELAAVPFDYLNK
jgi:hypothetical protein